jgi:hypothetical protein
VTARLHALHDDNITADIGRLDGLLGRADLPGYQCALIMDDPYKLIARVGVEELDNPADLRGLLDELARRPRRNAPWAERASLR